MSNVWRTYTIFISSTFADMQAERDYINIIFIPEMEVLFRDRNIILQVVDLRSGINTLDQKEDYVENVILSTCFDEINRSRPFFIGLLGEKYGWIPSTEGSMEYVKTYNLPYDTSITALEIEYGVLQRNNISGSIFLERDSCSYSSMTDEYKPIYDERYTGLSAKDKQYKIEKLSELKQKIRKHLKKKDKGDNYIVYTPRWDGSKFTDFHKMGEQLKERLTKEINNIFSEEIDYNKFERELHSQQLFVYKKTKRIFKRKDYIDYFYEKLTTTNNGYVLTGISGGGKSCIYASLVDYFMDKSEYITLYHSAGVTVRSTSAVNMLKDWCYQLEKILNIENNKVTMSEQALTYFHALIKKVKNRRIILLIDSLDNFVSSVIIDYLTIFPRYNIGELSLFATATTEYKIKVSSVNNRIINCNLRMLSRDDALGIIDSHSHYYKKSIHKANIDHLLSLSNGDQYAYESPLWLDLSLHLIFSLNQDDFTKIYSKKNDSFEYNLVNYINSLIAEFPIEEDGLFLYLLDRLEQFYGDLPKELFKYLSSSYHGMPENALKVLLKDKWDNRVFAIVRSYFSSFIAEQGLDKKWMITHKKIYLNNSVENTKLICSQIADYYTEQFDASVEVQDNLLYYYYFSEKYGETWFYYTNPKIKKETFGIQSLELIDVIGCEAYTDFISKVFINSKSKNLFKSINNTRNMALLYNIISDLCKKYLYLGENERVVLLSLFIKDKLYSIPMIDDVRIMYFILIDNIYIDAIDSADKRKQAYVSSLKFLKINGVISLFLVPIVRKYYKWNILKLNL